MVAGAVGRVEKLEAGSGVVIAVVVNNEVTGCVTT